MEKKYYFRGLGLGIIVTAIIMGIALPHGTKTREMTDDEVIARAKELGMTEDTRLLEPSGAEEDGEEKAPEAQTPVKKDIAVKAEQKPTVDTPEPVQSATSELSSETKPKTDTNEMTKQDDDAEPAAKTEGDEDTDTDRTPATTEAGGGADATSAAGTKTITIVGGDGSYTVAKKLETAGVVSSAASYDTYLCEHGYDKKLRTGTFQIPAGATDEQIARIVTGQ